MYTIDNLEAVIPLGQQGESGATSVTFDISAWVTLYPAGVYSLTYVRPGETTVYPEQAGAVATATVDDVTTLTWTPSDAVLDVAGNGTVVIHCTEDDVEKRSAMTSYYVALGHAAAGEAPDPVADWIEDATSKLAEVDPALGLAAGATLAANTAAELANAKAGLANDAAALASTKAGEANSAATSANNAADRADTIAGTMEGIAPLWADAEISVTPLEPYETPTAAITQDENGTHFDLGIPDGRTYFATFEINYETGMLEMTTPDGYDGPVFTYNEDTGMLEVTI